MRKRGSILTGLVVVAAISGAATFAACGSSSSPTTPSVAADVTVTMVADRGNQSYTPNPVSMRVGQTVAWKNVDSIPHTATRDTAGFDTGSIAAGATSTPVTMSAAGTFPYHCTLHPGMVGTITVQ